MPISCDPNELIQASRCLNSCVPAGMQLAVQTYLLCQLQELMAGPGRVLDSGIATLVGGQAVVNSADAKSTNPVLLTYYSQDGSLSVVVYHTVVDGVSFIIQSSDVLDAGMVSWAILQGP